MKFRFDLVMQAACQLDTYPYASGGRQRGIRSDPEAFMNRTFKTTEINLVAEYLSLATTAIASSRMGITV